MQQVGLFVTVKDLPGIPAGRVASFYSPIAQSRVHDGEIVPYDEEKHADLPGAPPRRKAAEVAPNKGVLTPVRTK